MFRTYLFSSSPLSISPLIRRRLLTYHVVFSLKFCPVHPFFQNYEVSEQVNILQFQSLLFLKMNFKAYLTFELYTKDSHILCVIFSATLLPVRNARVHLVQMHTSTGIPSQKSPSAAFNATRQFMRRCSLWLHVNYVDLQLALAAVLSQSIRGRYGYYCERDNILWLINHCFDELLLRQCCQIFACIKSLSIGGRMNSVCYFWLRAFDPGLNCN